jgi:group I intron endonuclease
MAKTEDSCYSVYCFTNKINNKKYIGLTHNIKERYKKHKYGSKRCPSFSLAIKKYGFNNFDFFILSENLTSNEAKLIERSFIKSLNSMSPNGYNRTEGGDSSVKHTKETIEKIKEKNRIYRLNNPHPMLGKKHSEESKELIRKYALNRKDRPEGELHWNFGMKHTESTKEKMSLSQSLGKNGFSKKVIDLNTNIIYQCIEEAKQVYNISHAFISMVCSGKRKSNKYNFMYLKDYEEKKYIPVNN